ncbi:tyrosine--tRNA ligase [Pontibacter sp. G13]|uniref:tyrosine--tRNA ligase n=1 Tax=Pontibacter sp. G13 TaxID=3074898 RepID=UPI002889C25A|nr:tyrosine--tRNA ligase [Pontibacter sp. G13]WNJ20902.1 tyrosine--tRNA ligase [Pontibacter sp. G13]
MNFIEELKWRGLIHDMIPGTETYLLENQVAGYLGVDPTGDSMHIGNLVAVMMMVHFQRAGHSPIALVGGATGLVGDPSGKDKERNLLTLEQVQHNVAGIRKQLEHFLDFETTENPAEVVNNYDWFGPMGFLDFLRDVGKHITVSYMMNKESVKKRMSGDTGISYTEFAYQLLQGYDFFHLYQNKGVRVQVGGSDQWGNITTGTELIRRMGGPEAKAFAVVCPLLTREDGSKFGKTADGQSVWLDPEKTSPYNFYQYWMNVGDQDAERFIKIFTLKEKEEIESLIATHQENPSARSLQQALAEDITRRVHGEEGLQSAIKLTAFNFARKHTPEVLEGLSASDWTAIANSAPDDIRTISKDKLEAGIGVLDFLLEIGVVNSKGEARRSIEKDRSITINAVKRESIEDSLGLGDAFFGSYLYVQKGKKNKFVIQVTA